MEAYKTEMTATLARVRLSLASDPREAAARLKADGSFRAVSGAVPSTSLPAEPAVETFPPRAGVDGDESKVRAEAEAARRARDRNAFPGTAFPGMEKGDDDPGARAAALVAEASARARAALDQFARAFPGMDGSSPASRPTTAPRRPSTAAARVAAAMAAAEAAAADSDEDRDDRDKTRLGSTPTRPVDRPDLHLREEEHEDEKGTERDAGTSGEHRARVETLRGGEHRARVETLRGASATAPTKTKTASSSAARPTMRCARAGSTSAVLVAARRAPGAGASVRGAPRGLGARRST